MVVENMRRQGEDVSNFAMLKIQWRNTGTEEFAALLWNACFGFFDSEPNWELELEEEYMK
jgi:hypothetical protein